MPVAEHLEAVRLRIAEAARAAGRDPESVRLIAVSKTKPVEQIAEAAAAGQLDFGENRVQELQSKQPALPHLHWHLIGTLQRNKVKYIAPYIRMIHSVDSAALLAEIGRQAAKHDREIDCLLQIHISGEETKSGMTPEEARSILEQLDAFPHVRICGLMGMAALTDDTALIRSQFAGLRQLRSDLAGIAHPRIALHELSMGMSGDFETAIQEGATMVRIGSAVFGTR
jgi:hypothetical protein